MSLRKRGQQSQAPFQQPTPWSDTFSNDKKEYSSVKLDQITVYSSLYFPDYLAKVIISGNIIFFVYHDEHAMMSADKCLHRNERILVEGIRKIDTSGKKWSLFQGPEEKAMTRYLKFHRFDRLTFESEQKFDRRLLIRAVGDFQ